VVFCQLQWMWENSGSWRSESGSGGLRREALISILRDRRERKGMEWNGMEWNQRNGIGVNLAFRSRMIWNGNVELREYFHSLLSSIKMDQTFLSQNERDSGTALESNDSHSRSPIIM
jgi:hypothetical protein